MGEESEIVGCSSHLSWVLLAKERERREVEKEQERREREKRGIEGFKKIKVRKLPEFLPLCFVVFVGLS